MLSMEGAAPTPPAFSLRFERGRGRLVLTRPFDVHLDAGAPSGPPSFARLSALELDLGPTRGGIRLKGGWSSVRTYRTEALAAVLEVDPTDATWPTGAGVARATLEGAAPGNALRVSFREGRRVIACELHPRWRGGDLALAVRTLRATSRRGPSALADLLEVLRPLGAELDTDAGVVVVARPIVRLLAEALLPLGMRIPSTRGAALDGPTVAVDDRGRAVLRVRLGESTAAGRAGKSSAGHVRAARAEHDAHAEARLLAAFTRALATGDVAAARHELGRVRARLAPSTEEELRAALELELDDEAELAPIPGDGLLPRLARARQAEAAGREHLEAAVRAWLAVETSDAWASAALVRMAEDARLEDRGRARWIARQAASRIARIVAADRSTSAEALLPLARRAIELSEGELPAEVVGELLPLLGGHRAEPATLPHDEASAALALALEAAGRADEAAALWRLLRGSEDAETVALAAARDERNGELLAALEGWDRAAELAARRGRAADARRAWVRAADLALSLSLEEAASERLERALDTLHAISADDAGMLVATVRRAGLVELAGRVEQLVIVALTADGGQSPALLGALEELLAWAIERGAATRARALHATLARVRPERAALESLPEEPEEPEEPRRRAERLRNDGRLAEAASVLAALGTAERDAATLRGALDLAERAAAWETARDIIDTLLGWVGEGPVAESLRRRRARLSPPG
jgi:hypothetical protein